MRPPASVVCLSTTAAALLLSGCYGSRIQGDADATLDPDVHSDADALPDLDTLPDPDAPADPDAPPDVVYDEDPVEWADCPARTSVEAMFTGPCPYTPGTSFESDGQVVSITPGDRTAIDIDFTASAPELGIATFDVPLHPGELADLSVGDTVHVEYGCYYIFDFYGSLTISRDGVTLVFSYSGGGIDPFEIDGMQFTAVEGGCEPYDFCGPSWAGWDRYYYEVTCIGLAEPVRVYDGAEVIVPCGPGYRVAVTYLLMFSGDHMYCTDTTSERDLFLVVRQ